MTTHTHAALIAHLERLRLALRMAPSPEVFTLADSIVAVCDALQSFEGKATEGEAPFEIGCTVKLKDADLVGTLLEFNEPITGALIRWSHNGDEIWKALRNLEVVSQPSEGEGPGADENSQERSGDLPSSTLGVAAEASAAGASGVRLPGSSPSPPVSREAVALIIEQYVDQVGYADKAAAAILALLQPLAGRESS